MNSKELWKDIKDYEGLYQVSNLGRVRSLDRTVAGKGNCKRRLKGRLLPTYLDHKGYQIVRLNKLARVKVHKLHRVLALAFVPKAEGKELINHIDGNPLNNSLENIEWCTQKENCIHAVRSGLTKTILKEEDIPHIRELHSQGDSYELLSIKYGVCKATIGKVILGINWAWVK